jgi:hypothetical protein
MITPLTADKRKALDLVMAQIDKQFGTGAIMRFGAALPGRAIETIVRPRRVRQRAEAAAAGTAWLGRVDGHNIRGARAGRGATGVPAMRGTLPLPAARRG